MKSDSKDFVGELTLLDPRPSFPGVEPSKEKKKTNSITYKYAYW